MMCPLLRAAGLALVFGVTVHAQFLDEDFSGGIGTTPPTGWSQVTDETGLLWAFDDPAGRGSSPEQVHPYAIFDSSFASTFGNDETVSLVSPPFDASTASQLFLEFDHEHIPLGTSSTVSVEIFDGALWNTVFSTSSAVGNGTLGGPRQSVQESLDITAAAGGSPAAQVRFTWNGTWDWWWTVDNVFVGEPIGGGGQAPRPGLATFDVNDAETASGFGIAMGLGGPYFVDVALGNVATFTFDGEPGQPIVLLGGDLSIGNIPLAPPLGQIDLDNIEVLISGLDPGLPGALMLIGPSGTAQLTFTVPVTLAGQSLAIQPYIANTTVAPPGGFGNCVLVTFTP